MVKKTDGMENSLEEIYQSMWQVIQEALQMGIHEHFVNKHHIIIFSSYRNSARINAFFFDTSECYFFLSYWGILNFVESAKQPFFQFQLDYNLINLRSLQLSSYLNVLCTHNSIRKKK